MDRCVFGGGATNRERSFVRPVTKRNSRERDRTLPVREPRLWGPHRTDVGLRAGSAPGPTKSRRGGQGQEGPLQLGPLWGTIQENSVGVRL